MWAAICSTDQNNRGYSPAQKQRSSKCCIHWGLCWLHERETHLFWFSFKILPHNKRYRDRQSWTDNIPIILQFCSPRSSACGCHPLGHRIVTLSSGKAPIFYAERKQIHTIRVCFLNSFLRSLFCDYDFCLHLICLDNMTQLFSRKTIWKNQTYCPSEQN